MGLNLFCILFSTNILPLAGQSCKDDILVELKAAPFQ